MLIYILEKDSNPKLNLPYTYVGLYVGFTVLIDLYNVRTHSLLKQTVKQAAEIIMKKYFENRCLWPKSDIIDWSEYDFTRFFPQI